MTGASWLSSMRHSRRFMQTGARGTRRSRASKRRTSCDALEDRVLLASVSFATEGESVNESSGGFAIAVTLSSSTPAISPFAFGINEPDGLAVWT
jgi:hypothetical protein